MTTQIHIVNSSDSNPSQHALVMFARSGAPDQTVRLAPGESKAFWIGPSDTISVTEIFEPKPVAVPESEAPAPA